MKSFFAWLLIVLISFHWIGSYVYFEISYVVEVQQGKNEAEQAIAQKIKQEIGVEGNIRFLHKDSLKDNHSYTSSLSFSTEIDNEKIYFAIEFDTSSAVKYINITYQNQPPSESSKMALLQDFFSKFIIPIEELNMVCAPSFCLSNFHYLEATSVAFLPTLTPPPDLA